MGSWVKTAEGRSQGWFQLNHTFSYVGHKHPQQHSRNSPPITRLKHSTSFPSASRMATTTHRLSQCAQVQHHMGVRHTCRRPVVKVLCQGKGPDPSAQPAPLQPTPPPAARGGSEYYAGLLQSDMQQTNNASSADMLGRSLQLAGECLPESVTSVCGCGGEGDWRRKEGNEG